MKNELIKIKTTFKNLLSSVSNFNNMEEINEVVKIFSVLLFLYKKDINLKTIVNKEYDFILLQIEKRLSSYNHEIWVFEKDKNYILKKILLDGNWSYGKPLMDTFDLFEANDIVLSSLKEILDQRKFILNKMKWE